MFDDGRFRVRHERRIAAALQRADHHEMDTVLVTGAALADAKLTGAEFVDMVSARNPMAHVIVLVQTPDVPMAVEALKAGSFHYIKLPATDDELRLMIETALANRPGISESGPPDGIGIVKPTLIGRSKAMRSVYRLITQASASDIPVLIAGETGTGKDLVAQAVHAKGRRREGPYVPVHLGALPQELVASELFGHEKGAFTGATERRIGKFEEADSGTIFLDEISTIDERVQVSLLRLIEQRAFNRLGGKRTLTSGARLITATNEDPSEMVANGLFRQDLLYRLDVFRISLPPLRERHGDVPPLVALYSRQFSKLLGKAPVEWVPETLALLEEYDWPGNIRELKNVVQRAVLVAAGGVVTPDHLPARFRPARAVVPKATFEIGTPLVEMEREMILRTLSMAENRTSAAQILGISRRALYNKMARYGIE